MSESYLDAGVAERSANQGPTVAERVGTLIVSLALSGAVAVTGSMATMSNVDGWYASAALAPWSPPNAVFGPVWTVLYISMAIAAWLVWNRRNEASVVPALWLYAVQLALNALWTPIFFSLYPSLGTAALWFAFAVILALSVALMAIVPLFWRCSRTAAILMIPYLAWILFAMTLNLYAALYN